MSAVDIGESLVGAYLRHVRGCEIVVFNSVLPDSQGEVNVVGLKHGAPRTVWLCEVVTHIDGMLLADSKLSEEEKMHRKLEWLAHFAGITFPGDDHRFEWWSPRVPVGKTTDAMDAVVAEWGSAGRDLAFVKNEDYTDRIRALVAVARKNPSTTNEPAFRMLQILTRLRGGQFAV